MTIIYAILIFCVLIFVHEFGHFITAKMCGVKVNEFVFIVELDGLNARDRLSQIAPVYSIAKV